MSHRHHNETKLLLSLIDQAYHARAWHGPTLKGALRGISPREALWRPAPGRRSIGEIAVHCAYWKYAVRRRLTGDKRGTFPLEGSNWFPLAEPLSEPQWRAYLRLLGAEHRLLREAVAHHDPARWPRRAPGGKLPHNTLAQGIAMHDVYHAGQIQTLKALLRKSRHA